MKTLHTYSRLFAALACAIGLGACGGNTATITIGGAISGLTTSGLLLTNAVSTVAPVANATSYVFPGSVSEGSSYTIGVFSQPTGLTCSFAGNVISMSGVAGGANITNADVTCVQSAFNLGGPVAGLTADGLVLADGSSTVAISAGSTSFIFATGKIQTGLPYGVTVLSQPAGQTCTIANGVGTAGTSDVTNVQVTCL